MEVVPFSKVTIGTEEVVAVTRVLTGANNKEGNVWLAAGEETEAFEREFSDYIAWDELDPLSSLTVRVNPFCIFTNSCTSALKMAYKWAMENGLTGVHYPPNTFCATY